MIMGVEGGNREHDEDGLDLIADCTAFVRIKRKPQRCGGGLRRWRSRY